MLHLDPLCRGLWRENFLSNDNIYLPGSLASLAFPTPLIYSLSASLSGRAPIKSCTFTSSHSQGKLIVSVPHRFCTENSTRSRSGIGQVAAEIKKEAEEANN